MQTEGDIVARGVAKGGPGKKDKRKKGRGKKAK